jgi:hypothetical protein
MVDEGPHLTKEERRQRQKRLEQARREARHKTSQGPPVAPAGPASDVAASPEHSPVKRRGRPKRQEVTVADVTGLKYFEKLRPLLERPHEVGCERDKAGNRELHYDEFCLFLLLGLFNPVVDSLRGLQQASELENG